MPESHTSNETKPLAPRPPALWTDSPRASWRRLERGVDHEAVAFASGAHQAYHDFKLWRGDVKALLVADWEETRGDAHAVWDRIRSTAKQGWDRASGGPRLPESPAAR